MHLLTFSTDTSKLPLTLLPRRRQGRGKLISVDGWPSRDSGAEPDPESTVSTDQTLSEIALESAESPHNKHIHRAHEEAKDAVEHAVQLATPKSQQVLLRVLQAIEAGESYKEAGLHQMQVKRAFDEVRHSIEQAARHIKRPPALVSPKLTEYNPRCVAWETYMQTHQGAIITVIGQDKRTSVGLNVRSACASGNPGAERPQKTGLYVLPRPKTGSFVKHLLFGRGLILQSRELDCGPVLDLEFGDGKRRTILASFCRPTG